MLHFIVELEEIHTKLLTYLLTNLSTYVVFSPRTTKPVHFVPSTPTLLGSSAFSPVATRNTSIHGNFYSWFMICSSFESE